MLFPQSAVYNNITMSQNDSESRENKRSYSKIPIKKRMLLVKQVVKRGKPLNQIIKQLNIKVTTARFIINKYKESGSFPRRKFRKNSKRAQKILKAEKKEESSGNPLQVHESEIDEGVGQNQQKNQAQLQTEQNRCPPFYMYWYYYPYGSGLGFN